MAGLTSLISGDFSAFAEKSSEAKLIDIEGDTPDSFLFQFWPENIMDDKSVNWGTIELPGGSHPLYHFINGGERTVTFMAQFYRERLEDVAENGKNNMYSRDIGYCVAWLRSKMYPRRDGAVMLPPPRLELWFDSFDGSMNFQSLNHYYDGVLNCIMTGCQVTYKAWFPNGVPRLAEVNLTFTEIITLKDGVQYADPTQFSSAIDGELPVEL